MTAGRGPRIPTAEEEVLKTLQCGFESHRGHHRSPQVTPSPAGDRRTRSEITAATTHSSAAPNQATV